MQLHAHLADLKAAFSDYKGWEDVRETFARLESSAVAQLISFMNDKAVQATCNTLKAVSPAFRLHVELAMHRDGEEDWLALQLFKTELVCHLKTLAPELQLNKPTVGWWWSRRLSTLPWSIVTENHRPDILRQLTAATRSKIKAICVQLSLPAKCTEDPACPCDGRCETFLCALPTFINLEHLDITCNAALPESAAQHAVAVNQALRVAAQNGVRCVNVHNFKGVCDTAALTSALHLRELSVWSCGLENLAGIANCIMLTYIDVSCNKSLKSLSSLAGATRLKVLRANYCDLRDVDGLGTCLSLEKLDVSGNHNLQSLEGLANAPQLRGIEAQCCERLRVLDGLNSCPALAEVSLVGCHALSSLDGIIGAPSLERIMAMGCNLRNVDGLHRCPSLQLVNFSQCRKLTSLDGLAGARQLKTLCAPDCEALRSLGNLNTCPELTKVDLSWCRNLRSLEGLVGAPRLEKLKAVLCGLHRIDEFAAFPSLRKLDVSLNEGLERLDGLAGLLRLEELRAVACGLHSLDCLTSCRALRTLNVSRNPGLSDIRSITQLTSLQQLTMCHCNVTVAPVHCASTTVTL